MNLLFLLWFFILPIIGLIALIFGPIFWFVIVPSVARMLTWARFSNCTLVAFGDDEGWAYLMKSKESLPEGVIRTKVGYNFLPRSQHKRGKVRRKFDVVFRKFILKGMGKPFWFGYVGKVGLMNPETLALTAGEELPMSNNPNPLGLRVKEIEVLVSCLPNNIARLTGGKVSKKQFRQLIKDVKNDLKKVGQKKKKITVIDPTKIKELLPKYYTPTQLESYGTKKETLGMKKRGAEIGKYVLGFGALMLLMVLSIVVVMAVTGSGIFGGGGQASENAGVVASSLATVVHCLF